jgi:hypothetical protein
MPAQWLTTVTALGWRPVTAGHWYHDGYRLTAWQRAPAGWWWTMAHAGEHPELDGLRAPTLWRLARLVDDVASVVAS